MANFTTVKLLFQKKKWKIVTLFQRKNQHHTCFVVDKISFRFEMIFNRSGVVGLKNKWKRKLHAVSYRRCRFPTKEIMGVLNFYVAFRFFLKLGGFTSNFALYCENFMTRRRLTTVRRSTIQGRQLPSFFCSPSPCHDVTVYGCDIWSGWAWRCAYRMGQKVS